MPDFEYVATLPVAEGPRGTVISAAAWRALPEVRRDEFVARKVAEAPPAPAPAKPAQET